MTEILERKRLTNETWIAMLKWCEHRCLKCGVESFSLSQDHVIPLDKGGSNEADNIQPLCLRCNQVKGISTEDYRRSDWPWLAKNLIPAENTRLPSTQFLSGMARVVAFMKAWRTHASSFVSANDPHLRWMRAGAGEVTGECGGCMDEPIVLTQQQVDRGADNFITEAHVAWHLAKELMVLASELEGQARNLYLPRSGR
jgi:hypothetical protein